MHRYTIWYGGIGLDSGDVVLDGDSAPPKGDMPPNFSAHIHCGQTAAHLRNCWALVLLAYLFVLRLTYTSNILG